MRIIGHRGARGEAPENTLGGFEYLKQLGVRAVEFDVRQLKDATTVIMHDDSFLRTTGHAISLYECMQNDLCQYDHRLNWPVWTQAEYTPTFSQAMAILKDFEHIEVEIKHVEDLAQAERLTARLDMELQDFHDQIIMTSFDEKVLTTLQTHKSRFKRGFLIETDIKAEAIEKALALGCCHIGWMDRLATPEMIQLSHDAGLTISVWTVNDVERAKALRDLGIEGLITDVPKLMLAHLD